MRKIRLGLVRIVAGFALGVPGFAPESNPQYPRRFHAVVSRACVLLGFALVITTLPTQAQVFSTPLNISANPGSSLLPQIAVDAQGNIIEDLGTLCAAIGGVRGPAKLSFKATVKAIIKKQAAIGDARDCATRGSF